MPELAKLVNTDLSRGFTVSRVAEKHGWTEPMIWSVALEGKSDLERFKALNWGLKTCISVSKLDGLLPKPNYQGKLHITH